MAKKRPNYANAGRKTGTKQILLSISILVSGRGETMEKCISSLDRLRSRVPCELILTDTGCPEEAQEWLAQKADRLLKFQWRNDFAAARNVGLKEARGLWFMFMDDDEWFEDTGRIESFFLSGEYKRYQSASYMVRNYVNMEGTLWRDIHLTRMTLRRPVTHFFYPIHETLWPLLEPEKYLDDYVHHYGYASEDPEVQMAKRDRNLGILLSTIKEDPHCMKHYLQAVAEYYAMDDWASAVRMADEGIANRLPGRTEDAIHIDGLYASAVRMRLREGRSEEAYRLGREYLESVSLIDLAKASICGDLAVACGELGEQGQCLDYLREYLRWKAYFKGNRAEWLKQDTLILDGSFEDFQYRKAMGWGFAAALALGSPAAAEGLLAEEPLEWWLEAVQRWYTLSAEQGRERWQADFRAVMEVTGGAGETGKNLRTDCWEESGEPYARLWQIYRILTAPEAEIGAETGSEEERGEADSLALEAAREMEALSAQLKDRVRQMLREGQRAEALSVIGQLQALLPTDRELEALREECYTSRSYSARDFDASFASKSETVAPK